MVPLVLGCTTIMGKTIVYSDAESSVQKSFYLHGTSVFFPFPLWSISKFKSYTFIFFVYLWSSGNIYEHAVLLSVKVEDQGAFERDFFQLKPYYTDAQYVSFSD